VEGHRGIHRCALVDQASKSHHCWAVTVDVAQPSKTCIVADEPCSNVFSFGRDVLLPLRATPGGLGHFHLVGFSLGHLVRARWDGVELRISPELYHMALMSAAVEEAFRADRDDGFEWSDGCAERVALDLVGSMDDVAMVEYSMGKHCDALRRTWYLGGVAMKRVQI